MAVNQSNVYPKTKYPEVLDCTSIQATNYESSAKMLLGKAVTHVRQVTYLRWGTLPACLTASLPYQLFSIGRKLEAYATSITD